MASRIPDDKWRNLTKKNKEFLEKYHFLDQGSGGNIQLDDSIKGKIFDLLGEDSQKLLLKRDVVNLIRFYCCLYSDFKPKALKVLQAQTLEQFNRFMKDIPEEQREEMYKSMSKLFDAVRGWRVQRYGDSELIDEDTIEIKKRLAVFIFPEKFQFQRGVTQSDTSEPEPSSNNVNSEYPQSSGNDNSDIAYHDENMEEYQVLVTAETLLKRFGVSLKAPANENSERGPDTDVNLQRNTWPH